MLFKKLLLTVACVLFAASLASYAGAPLTLENRSLKFTLDPDSCLFQIQSKPSGRTFVTDGHLTGTGGKAKAVKVPDARFGPQPGDGIEVEYPNGNRDTIALHDSSPFVFFSTTLRNNGSEVLVIQRQPGITAGLAFGKPQELKTLGTGGLLTPAANPGSYAFLSVVDPATRAGVVGGWVTDDRGSGVVFSPVTDGTVQLRGQIDYGRLRILPGRDASTELFVLGWFDDARLGLEAYGDAIASAYSIHLLPKTAGFCTWYMDKYAGASDEKHLKELSAVAAKELKPFGFDFVQIDDMWQEGVKKNGPARNFTTHRPDGPYPSGMKAAADGISSLGLRPGIWFMPFAGTANDPYFTDHQDWFAKGPDGKPFETAWGGTCLDMTQAGARGHLRDVVSRIAHQWGYTLFKMDGLWTGTVTKQIYVNDGYKDDAIGEATLSNPDKTNIEAYRDGLKLVREVAGKNVFLLGCCVSQNMRSMGGAFGLLDGMRIGPDTGGRIGAPHGSRLWFMNGRVWHDDPDCVMVRAAKPVEEARLNATWASLSDQLFYVSDWLPELPADRLDILKRCMLPHGATARPVDVFETQPACVWLVTGTTGATRHDIVALYNWNNAAASIDYPIERIGLPPATEYVAFDFWANRFVPPFKGSIRSSLPGVSCRVLAVRPVADHPQVLSTSRHVAQGIVDAATEAWVSGALSGAGRVVANDPYEVRIIVPVGAKSWKPAGITVSTEDAAAGVTASVKSDGPKVRATIVSPASREVRWRIAFEPASVEVPEPKPVTGLKAAAEYREVTLHWADQGADAYRVTRDDGASFDLVDSSFTDRTVNHGKHYRYTVASVGWNGAASPVSSVDVDTPAELKPPTTLKPTTLLTDLKPVQLKSGWGKPGIDKNAQGKPLRVNGKTYARGLGLHAPGLAVYDVPAGATRFVSVVGLDDSQQRDPRASVVFEVYGDVKEMGEAPALLGQSPVLSAKSIRNWAFNCELTARVKQVRLVITDAGDGNAADHADWVDAGFVTGK